MTTVEENRGYPTTRALVAESLRATVNRPMALALTALVVAAACAVTLATAGRTAATEAQVLGSIDSVGTRLITVVDANGDADIDPSSVDAIAALEGVAWTIGLGPATTAENPSIGPRRNSGVSARPFVGDITPDIGSVTGRMATEGEAIAGSSAAEHLGLIDGVGSVDAAGRSTAVVGILEPTGSLPGLHSTVLYRAEQESFPVRVIYVLAASGTDVSALAQSVDASVVTPFPQAVETETSEAALALREVISGVLGGGARQLMGIVLGTGLFLVSATTFGAVAARRRDFGRQRALGATRLDIVVTVLTQTGVASAIGTALGGVVGLTATYVLAGALPTMGFVIGLFVLVVYMALLGSLPPAIAAARRDPVRILRVP